MDWTHSWAEITSVRATEKGVELLIGNKGKKMMGMFGSSEQQRKLLQIPLKDKREHIALNLDFLRGNAKKDLL